MTKIDQTTMRPSDDVAWWERLRKALKSHVQKKLATVIKKTHVAQEWAIEAHKRCLAKGEKLEELPHQYQKFADIFDEEKSHRFPPS
jgi:tRNA(Ile)-lysidine synthase TilS/MesJ